MSTLFEQVVRIAKRGRKRCRPAAFDLRVQTCAACEYHTGLRCRLCGCFTGAKAALAHEECPIGQWPA